MNGMKVLVGLYRIVLFTSRPASTARWEKPLMNRVKVNLDAALQVENRKIGVGIIIKDSAGEVLAAMCVPIQSITDPTVAEVVALWKTLNFCKITGS